MFLQKEQSESQHGCLLYAVKQKAKKKEEDV